MSHSQLCTEFATSVTLKSDLDLHSDTPFRFRDMPKELRFMVYEHTLSFTSIDKYFKGYLDLLTNTDTQKEAPPSVDKVCPPILLISKDMTAEALPFLYSAPLHLSYGIFAAHLKDLIAPELLRKLRYIKISDVDCRHLVTPVESGFSGYCHAVSELATILRPGHSLRSLAIDFRSDYVTEHLVRCLFADRVCGIKTWVHNIARYLKELRNVKKVTLDIELPDAIKENIMTTMNGSPHGFLALPLAIRKKIYRMAASYNDSTTVLSRISEDLAFNRNPRMPVKSTPTILLLNKQILTECLEDMYTQPLIIRNIHPINNSNTPLSLDMFFTPLLLRRITSLEIHLTDHRHLAILFPIAATLRTRRTKLASLKLVFTEPRSKRQILATGQCYPDQGVWLCLRPLNHLRGRVEKVVIEGSLPECFTAPIIWNMTVKQEGERAKPLLVRDATGREVDVHTVMNKTAYKRSRARVV